MEVSAATGGPEGRHYQGSPQRRTMWSGSAGTHGSFHDFFPPLPNDDAIVRLVGAAAERTDECAVQRARYMTL